MLYTTASQQHSPASTPGSLWSSQDFVFLLVQQKKEAPPMVERAVGLNCVFPKEQWFTLLCTKKTQITSLFLLSRNILQSKGPQDPGPSCCWAIKLVKVPFLAQSNTRNKGNTTSLLLHTKSLGCTVSAQPYQLSWEQLFSSRHISPWISWHHKEEGRLKK